MNESETPTERQCRMEACADMSFDELYQFIEYSLEERPDADPTASPTEEEFLALLRMLREKASELAPYRNMPSERPSLRPKDRLASLRHKRKKTELFLLTYRGDPSISRKNIRSAERRWDEMGQEIRELEDEIRYGGLMYKWPSIPEPTALTPSQMVEKLRRKIERVFRPAVPVTEYQWESVPPGENPVDAIARSFKEWHQRNPRVAYDEDRIEKARSLKPKRGYTGKRKFDGYFIYDFDYTEKMIMECPIYGNAIFVLGPSLEPERWLQMKKRQIMEHPEATRIPHREGWFDKVREELGAPKGE